MCGDFIAAVSLYQDLLEIFSRREGETYPKDQLYEWDLELRPNFLAYYIDQTERSPNCRASNESERGQQNGDQAKELGFHNNCSCRGKMQNLITVASFNVNGIRARMPLLRDWLQKARPDILALQETKVSDQEFPFEEIREAGYFCVWSGRKGFNGVAILSLKEISSLQEGFQDGGPEDRDRLILAKTYGIKVLNTYVPQGTAVDSERFQYKLSWFTRLLEFMKGNLDPEVPILWLGDFNVAPEAKDVYDPVSLEGEIGYHPKERDALEKVREWGWVDVFRLHVKEGGHYTFWDYRIPNAVARGLGWRVDHIWATRPLARFSKRAWIDVQTRKAQRPSDHAPILAEFEIGPLGLEGNHFANGSAS